MVLLAPQPPQSTGFLVLSDRIFQAFHAYTEDLDAFIPEYTLATESSMSYFPTPQVAEQQTLNVPQLSPRGSPDINFNVRDQEELRRRLIRAYAPDWCV